MKKTVKTSVVGMMMAAALAAPVHAADDTRTMEVEYKEPNNYVISIPSSVTLKKSEEVSTSITATAMNIEPNFEVQVSIKSGIDNGNVTLSREGGSENTTSKVSFTAGGDAIADNAIVASFENQSTVVKTYGTLFFTALPDNLEAGEWKGQITFLVSVEQTYPF